MKLLNTHTEEMKESFDSNFCKLRSDGYMELINLHAPDLKSFITNSNKQLYIKIAEGELDRLGEIVSQTCNNKAYSDGFNDAINFQINYWNNILQELNK